MDPNTARSEKTKKKMIEKVHGGEEHAAASRPSPRLSGTKG